MKKLVVLTGAGMSAESGISTFRDADGLWEGHDIMEVASPEGFANNPELVLDFYNKRREQLKHVSPNQGHFNLKQLEKHFEVYIVTQNVDDLHERAESTSVLHLHGELRKVRSTANEHLVYSWEDDLVLWEIWLKTSRNYGHILCGLAKRFL
jgi:NAD-dependent deacetylase